MVREVVRPLLRAVAPPRPLVHAGVPDAPPPVAPRRDLDALRRELLAAVRVSGLPLAVPALARAPRGDGGRVVLLPGWGAPEATMRPLQAYLRALGHDAVGWGQGVNRGRPEEDRDALLARLDAGAQGDEPVALVGWSLGGVIAREVARERPDRVRAVVTYGSPAVGGPTYTVGASSFGEAECRRAEALVTELDAQRPIRVPITAIFTRQDGVVDWRAAIDRASPRVRHVEVVSSHMTLGLDPDVWLTVARALALDHPGSEGHAT